MLQTNGVTPSSATQDATPAVDSLCITDRNPGIIYKARPTPAQAIAASKHRRWFIKPSNAPPAKPEAASINDAAFGPAHQRPSQSDDDLAFGPVVVDARPAPSIDAIVSETERYFKFSRAELLSRRRYAQLAMARHTMMYLAYNLTSRSLPDVGRRLNGFDHTTILNAVKNTRKRIDSCDGPTLAAVSAIKQELGNRFYVGGGK